MHLNVMLKCNFVNFETARRELNQWIVEFNRTGIGGFVIMDSTKNHHFFAFRRFLNFCPFRSAAFCPFFVEFDLSLFFLLFC